MNKLFTSFGFDRYFITNSVGYSMKDVTKIFWDYTYPDWKMK